MGHKLAPFALTAMLLLTALFPVVGQGAKSENRGDESLTAPDGAIIQTNSMEFLDDKRPLLVGDRLSYRVVQERTEPRSTFVADSGEMEVPLIGRVSAAGKTCKQLATEIKKTLEKTYFFHATVIVSLDIASPKSKGTVFVMGAVRNQGMIEIPSDGTFTMSKAIMRAGGFTEFANQRKVKLIRKGESGEPALYDVKGMLEGKAEKDPILHVDDVVIVTENRIHF